MSKEINLMSASTVRRHIDTKLHHKVETQSTTEEQNEHSLFINEDLQWQFNRCADWIVSSANIPLFEAPAHITPNKVTPFQRSPIDIFSKLQKHICKHAFLETIKDRQIKRNLDNLASLIDGHETQKKYMDDTEFVTKFNNLLKPEFRISNKEEAQSIVNNFDRFNDYNCFFNAVIYGDRTVVKLFIKANININIPNCDGYTPLMLAARNDRSSVLLTLIDAGAYLDQQHSETRFTALMLATRHGNKESALLLINAGTDLSLKNSNGSTASILFDIRDEYGLSNLMDLIEYETILEAERILESLVTNRTLIINEFLPPVLGHIISGYDTERNITYTRAREIIAEHSKQKLEDFFL